MSEQEPTPLDYQSRQDAQRQGPLLPIKWLFFIAGVLTTVMSAESRGTIGCAAAGLWVAFALIHVQEIRDRAS